MQVILGFIDTYLRLSEEEQSAYKTELQKLEPAEKEAVMAVTIQWKEEGRQEGLQQGLQEGLQQGMLMVVLQILEKRFGQIGDQTRAQIERLNSEELKTLSDALLDLGSLDEVETWLAACRA